MYWNKSGKDRSLHRNLSSFWKVTKRDYKIEIIFSVVLSLTVVQRKSWIIRSSNSTKQPGCGLVLVLIPMSTSFWLTWSIFSPLRRVNTEPTCGSCGHYRRGTQRRSGGRDSEILSEKRPNTLFEFWDFRCWVHNHTEWTKSYDDYGIFLLGYMRTGVEEYAFPQETVIIVF
jgi:hypothetical protein